MYQSAPVAYGLFICWSMNSGTPASSAPGPRSSFGISRATAACKKRDSSALKKLGV